MAKTDPNTSSRTMPARMTPSPVPPKDGLVRRLGHLAGHRHLQMRPAGGLGRVARSLGRGGGDVLGQPSKVTVANAVRAVGADLGRPRAGRRGW